MSYFQPKQKFQIRSVNADCFSSVVTKPNSRVNVSELANKLLENRITDEEWKILDAELAKSATARATYLALVSLHCGLEDLFLEDQSFAR